MRQDARMPVRVKLVLSSALMLLLELALIRWLGGAVIHLSYFSNIVLLASFLGIGVGFIRSGRTTRQPYYFPIALAVLLLVVDRFPIGIDRTDSDVVFFTTISTVGPPPWVVLPIIFIAVAFVMAGPGELVGSCFKELPRLEAYRWDLIGSLTGIAVFTLISFLRAPPVVWGVIVLVMLWALFVRAPIPMVAATTIVFAVLYTESIAPGVSWSPYYKMNTEQAQTTAGTVTTISANGVPHQAVYSVSERLKYEPLYDLPYERQGPNAVENKDVLIIGAGTGTDVALALKRGARSVDAVEIDPRIQQIGAQINPDRPYDDPRVTVHINDGRAFLQQTDKQFDLVIFALPDSLALVAGASSLRLESYLFTKESMERAAELVKPGGGFAMYNYYREDWLVGRLANTMEAAFGHSPCIDVYQDRSAVLYVGKTESDQECGSADTSVTNVSGPAAVGDSQPFLYLKDRSIPALYLWVLLAILIISVTAVRVVGGPLRQLRPYTDLFLLGAAFLLLQTKAVAGFALLFGTTWVVNSIVFSGVLVAVLLAVEFTRRFGARIKVPVAYALLLASLLLAWLVPNAWLLGLPLPLRLVTAVTIAFLPIFTANVVFARRFSEAADPTYSFGANLLGAMLGGCLEYAALVVGYPALLGLAALLYLGAFLAGRSGSRTAVAVG
jgi:SAM-dependent methyltransferase